MAASERLMVAATLDDVRRGTAYERIPAHLTVYPWFDLPVENWPAFDAGMHEIISETIAPQIVGGSTVLYGEHNDTPVRLLDVATPTFNVIKGFDIHAGVYVLAHELGDNHDDAYTGLRWSPHVTSSRLREFNKGEHVALKSLTIFTKDAARSRKLAKAVYRWAAAETLPLTNTK